MSKQLRTEDTLQLEGIMSKGYGSVAKFVMMDVALTIADKGLYAYLCSLTGNGVTTFPKRETILYHLNMGKKAYYASYHRLIEHGYLKVQTHRKQDNHWAVNHYTIVLNPKRYQDSPYSKAPKKGLSQLRFTGMLTHGFGLIPKLVMQDTRLSVKEKGLYAYLLSYAGVGAVAFPAAEQICYQLQMNRKSFYKYMETLCRLGYIIRTQPRECGRFMVCDYLISENPVPCPKKGDTANTDVDVPCPKKEDTVNADADAPCPKKGDTANTDVDVPCPKKEDTANADAISPCPKKADTKKSDSKEADTKKADSKKEDTSKTSISKTIPSKTNTTKTSSSKTREVESSSQCAPTCDEAKTTPTALDDDSPAPDGSEDFMLFYPENLTYNPLTGLDWRNEQEKVQYAKDRWTHFNCERSEEETVMEQTLLSANGIPDSYRENVDKLVQAIHQLTSYEEYQRFGYSLDRDKHKTYLFVVKALSQMMQMPQSKVFRGLVPRNKIIDRLNRSCIVIHKDNTVSLDDFIDTVVSEYMDAVQLRQLQGEPPIQKPTGYARYVIWSVMEKYQKPEETDWECFEPQYSNEQGSSLPQASYQGNDSGWAWNW